MPLFVKTEIIKSEYIINRSLKNEFIDKHKIWVKKLKNAGINIKSGFLVDKSHRPGAGGLLIIEAKNYKDALEIIKHDPMIENNIVEWKLNEWIEISTIS